MKLLTLKSYSQFKKVLYKGSKVECNAFVFFYIKSSDAHMPANVISIRTKEETSSHKPYPDNYIANAPKFGFIASRKQFKRAVDRNRAKRRIRAALQGTLQRVDNKKSKLIQGECVFILRKPILNVDFLEIKKLLSTL